MASVTQPALENATTKQAEKRCHPRNNTGGIAQSFVGLGYVHIGLDGASPPHQWWSCSGVNGSHYTAAGEPIINKTNYPDLPGWTKRAASLGMIPGWYMNICGRCKGDYIALKSTEAYEQNAKAVVEYGFGGLKIDGCTGNHNSTLWGELLAETGK